MHYVTRQVEPKDYTGQAAVLTHLRVAKSLAKHGRLFEGRIGKRLKGTVGKLFLLGEEQPRFLLSLGSPKLELFRFSEGKQLEEFVSHRTVRR